MSDDCIYWDPRLREECGVAPAFPASALPEVAGHPVQSLFFSVDPWAVCSVVFYASCVMLLWAGLVFFAIQLVTAGFAPRPLYVCRIEAVRATANWFNLASNQSAGGTAGAVYDICFDERLPNEHGLLFVTLPDAGPICLTLKSTDQSDDRAAETNSFVIDWSSAPIGAQLEPEDLVSQNACVYFGTAQAGRTQLEPVDTDYD
jgi:hypothetical protein